jgi:gamma-glutamyltranspeptidase
MRGVVAAGHPATAEAGAAVLREGGNAVDAAVAAVLMSFAAESPLTGAGAGGFMLVHTASGDDQLLDFFVAAPGKGLTGVEPAALQPIDVHFSKEAIQVFNIGPSSCGVYGTPLGVAYALDLLERLGRPGDLRALVQVMDAANKSRTEEFVSGLHSEGYLERFLHKEALQSAASGIGSRLGSTTHIAVLDDAGACVSVTCSNGSCSGVIVPGTGVHLNNMMGEQDLNPYGYHQHQPGRRIPSMMSPTVVLSDGMPEVGLGSAGSNRIRSAILQTILGVVDDGLPAQEAVDRPRLHYENGVVEAEPGVDPQQLDALEHDGYEVRRFAERNLYFGGAQAVARDPETGVLSGGGDPRRGGAAVLAD